jgi:hypothetical protein
MTHGTLIRWLILAASTGMTPSEFRSLVADLSASDPNELTHIFNEVRRRLRQIQIHELDTQINFPFDSKTAPNTIRSDIFQLVKRANIKPSRAAELIRGKLLITPDMDASAVPVFNVKEGFGRWMDKAARSVGSSKLLNAAISALSPENTDDPQKWRLSRP